MAQPSNQKTRSNRHQGVNAGDVINMGEADEQTISRRLIAELPGVHPAIISLFEYTNGEVRIKPLTTLEQENNDLPIDWFQKKLVTATNVRLLIENPIRGVPKYTEDYEARADLIRNHMSYIVEGWPKPLVDVMLHDPERNEVDSIGINMICAKFGLGSTMKRSGSLFVSPSYASRIASHDEFENFHFSDDLDPSELGSNKDQLDRRLNNLFTMLTPVSQS